MVILRMSVASRKNTIRQSTSLLVKDNKEIRHKAANFFKPGATRAHREAVVLAGALPEDNQLAGPLSFRTAR